MNFHAAIERQNREASLADFEAFLSAFKTLSMPKFVPHVTHPEQQEITEVL